jgi:hypothetical protein
MWPGRKAAYVANCRSSESWARSGRGLGEAWVRQVATTVAGGDKVCVCLIVLVSSVKLFQFQIKERPVLLYHHSLCYYTHSRHSLTPFTQALLAVQSILR